MDVERQARGAENHLLGKWGEALVAEDLRKKGWQVLAAGYRCRLGEIDLIARKGRFIVFLEVKLRKSEDYGRAAEAVDRRKQSRLRATAQLYLAQRPTDLQPRFDVAEVYAPQGMETPAPRIGYIENAF
ncbi:MAG: YraN family protein [Oscillospiraceae bacterium]|jgi:putative endonuclease